ETTLYLHVFDWPRDGILLVPGLKNQIKKAFLLTGKTGHSLKTEQVSGGVRVSVPPAAPDSISSTLVLRIKGAPEVDQIAIVQDPDGSIQLTASEADLHGSQIKYESGDRRDNIGFWFDPAEWAEWNVQITKPGKFEISAEIAASEAASVQVAAGTQK